MQQGIHPTWFHNAVVTCACGNTFVTGSTLEKIDVDICAKCHPFFTGEMRFVDRQGRVDAFNKKMAAAQAAQAAAQSTKKGKKAQSDEQPQSYQEILRAQRTKLRTDNTTSAQQ